MSHDVKILVRSPRTADSLSSAERLVESLRYEPSSDDAGPVHTCTAGGRHANVPCSEKDSSSPKAPDTLTCYSVGCTSSLQLPLLLCQLTSLATLECKSSVDERMVDVATVRMQKFSAVVLAYGCAPRPPKEEKEKEEKLLPLTPVFLQSVIGYLHFPLLQPLGCKSSLQCRMAIHLRFPKPVPLIPAFLAMGQRPFTLPGVTTVRMQKFLAVAYRIPHPHPIWFISDPKVPYSEPPGLPWHHFYEDAKVPRNHQAFAGNTSMRMPKFLAARLPSIPL